ncbi:MAG: winged helix-turn-helix domain-containing protein [Candidatus Dormibacterales bacterium]
MVLLSSSARLVGGLTRELPGVRLAWHRRPAAVQHEHELDVLVVEGEDPVPMVAGARRITAGPLLAVGDGERGAAACLELGADAWLPGGSPPALVAAQVRALLRAQERRQPAPRRMRAGRLSIDSDARRVTLGDREVDLAPQEFELLRVLVAGAGTALSRDRILASAWGPRFVGEPKTVDVHVAWLRPKLEGSGLRVTTVRGIGYRLDLLLEGARDQG